MAHLKIKNIGAINSVDIDLNKINIIIGHQSSGKSTICKIACYCSWVEKRVCLTQSFDFFLKGNNFLDGLSIFHKLNGYFRSNSSFEYESDAVKFSYDHSQSKPSFEWKNRYNYKRTKISYMPSERNLVAAIPNWLEVKFEDNNIRNFMIDWTGARKIYTKEHPLSILKLGVQYYYDARAEQDFVVVDEQGTTLDLTNTSSGLQSIIPLEVVTEYLTSHIYKNVNISRSVKDEQINSILQEKIYADLFKQNNSSVSIPVLGDAQTVIMNPDGDWEEISIETDNDPFAPVVPYLRIFTSKEEMERYDKKVADFLNVQHTKLYIEEPEQNIFPETQRDVLYRFLELVKSNNDHSLFLTTHSPYILNALNNCMMGYLVEGKMPTEEQKRLQSKKQEAWINPALVSAYEITKEGTLQSIQNEKTRTIGKHYFNRISNTIMDEYYDMLNYLEADKDEK